MVWTEGLLIVREGMLCRAVLSAPPVEGLTPQQTLSALNAQPCEQILTNDGVNLTMRSPAGDYRISMISE